MIEKAMVLVGGVSLLVMGACEPPESGTRLAVDVAVAAGAPCVLTLDPVGVEIVATGDGEHPFPRSSPTVLDRNGRLYAATYEDGVVARWDADGRFDGSTGGYGDGPRELHRLGGLALGPGDSVHVFHRGRWSILSPDLTVLEVARSPLLASGGAFFATVLEDGRLLVPAISEESARPIVAVLSRTEGVTRELGADRFGDAIIAADFGIAYPGHGDSFWVGPVDWDRDRYVLERWDLSGAVLDRIERSIDWIPTESIEDTDWPVRFSLRQSRHGLLHVTAQVPDPTGDSAGLPAGMPAMLGRFELIRPDSGELVTSGWQGNHPAGVGPMMGRLPNTGMTFRITGDRDRQTLEMLRMTFEPVSPEFDGRCPG